MLLKKHSPRSCTGLCSRNLKSDNEMKHSLTSVHSQGDYVIVVFEERARKVNNPVERKIPAIKADQSTC